MNNPILGGIARRLGCAEKWKDVIDSIDALIKQRDELKIDAERFRTSFYKLRRKTEAASRQLEGARLSEAVENGGTGGVDIVAPIPPFRSDFEIFLAANSRECSTCGRLIAPGACPSCEGVTND